MLTNHNRSSKTKVKYTVHLKLSLQISSGTKRTFVNHQVYAPTGQAWCHCYLFPRDNLCKTNQPYSLYKAKCEGFGELLYLQLKIIYNNKTTFVISSSRTAEIYAAKTNNNHKNMKQKSCTALVRACLFRLETFVFSEA